MAERYIIRFANEAQMDLAERVMMCNHIKKACESTPTEELVSNGETTLCYNDFGELTPTAGCTMELYCKKDGVIDTNTKFTSYGEKLHDGTGYYMFKPSDGDILTNVVYASDDTLDIADDEPPAAPAQTQEMEK